MTRRFRPPPPEAIAHIRALAERRLSPAEFDAYLNAPMSAEEKQEIHSLIDWFTRRYKTPAERLAWARRAYARWAAAMPPAAAHPAPSPETSPETSKTPAETPETPGKTDRDPPQRT